MKISSLGYGTIVFSIGIFFFNLTSGRGLPSSNTTFLTIAFEDISIIISIVAVYLVSENVFEDSDKYKNWFTIFTILGIFSALFVSTFFDSKSSSFNNYLIYLSYLLVLLLVFLIMFANKKKQLADSKKQKVIKLGKNPTSENK